MYKQEEDNKEKSDDVKESLSVPSVLKIGKSFFFAVYVHNELCNHMHCPVQTFPTIAMSASIMSFHLEYCSSCGPAVTTMLIGRNN